MIRKKNRSEVDLAENEAEERQSIKTLCVWSLREIIIQLEISQLN